MIQFAKQQGYRVVLATNPLFPRIATEERIRWAGLVPSDFECVPDMAYILEVERYLQPRDVVPKV